MMRRSEDVVRMRSRVEFVTKHKLLLMTIHGGLVGCCLLLLMRMTTENKIYFVSEIKDLLRQILMSQILLRLKYIFH